MSLTQRLNEVIQSAKDLTQAVRETYSKHDEQIEEIMKVAPDLRRTFYVDAVNGDNSNDGTQENPLRTLRKAFDLVPRHGRGFIYLLSDYHMNEPVIARDCHINLYGDENNHRKITFGSYIHVSGGEESSALNGFRWYGSSYINFCFLDFKLPTVAPEHAGLSSSSYLALVSCSTSVHTGNQGVTFRFGNIHIPTVGEGTPAGHILAHFGPVGVFFSAMTASGAGLKDHISRNDNPASYVMNIPLDELP
ncbi:hypothetical protein PSE_2287 [Pseudovibrio sp. FO-BEG1]|uniref:hypothetical protein n=1 Tax=Pseudovibrio sp. (strain FO-BEG1) TaxID=911045 RepID=UPI000238C9EB|nr:hypothetical protein [Pseudovibrio sp. FO-BEG1]AEV36797.1 hypothetical protein PSE_2287 [Pseudovibrio sp. FO-BEG1]